MSLKGLRWWLMISELYENRSTELASRKVEIVLQNTSGRQLTEKKLNETRNLSAFQSLGNPILLHCLWKKRTIWTSDQKRWSVKQIYTEPFQLFYKESSLCIFIKQSSEDLRSCWGDFTILSLSYGMRILSVPDFSPSTQRAMTFHHEEGALPRGLKDPHLDALICTSRLCVWMRILRDPSW